VPILYGSVHQYCAYPIWLSTPVLCLSYMAQYTSTVPLLYGSVHQYCAYPIWLSTPVLCLSRVTQYTSTYSTFVLFFLTCLDFLQVNGKQYK